MTKHRLAILAIVLLPLVAIAATSPAAGPDPQVTQLKKQLRNAQARISDLQDQIDAQNDLLADQAATITRLRARLANQPDALDVILARDPDGLWQAMRAIWIAFPAADPCGYDKSYVPADGVGLTLTTYTFYRFGC